MNDGHFPGGPTSEQVIEERKGHRCTQIWQGKDDPDGKKMTQIHGRKMMRVLLEIEGPRRQLLRMMGFSGIMDLPWQYTDANLCFAVAERFWHKTNTFHLPCGEMAITYEDVHHILRLPVIGRAMLPVPCDDYIILVTNLLGRLPLEDTKHFQRIKKGKINLTWLVEEFAELPANSSVEEVQYYTRAYILLLCGCYLFPDATGTSVDLDYLALLEDLDENMYNWGGAVLAYLYTSLRSFVMGTNSEIRGCAILLQVWAHIRFPSIGTPIVREGRMFATLAHKYCGGNSSYTTDPHHTLVYYRQELDLLTNNKVIWTPYPPFVDLMIQGIRHTSILICLNHIHYHPADRCKRQWRLLQDIPEEPLLWESAGRGGRHSQRVLEEALLRYNMVFQPDTPFFVNGQPLTDDDVPGGVTTDSKNWYGQPMLNNPNVTYVEPRFEPRGYHEQDYELLCQRCKNAEKYVENMARNYRIEATRGEVINPWNLIQSLENLAINLQSTSELRRVPEERFVAPQRRSRFQQVHQQDDDVHQQDDDVHQHNEDVQQHDDDEEEEMNADEGTSYTPRPHMYLRSSSTQRPQTPIIPTPPYAQIDPSQPHLPRNRPRRQGRVTSTAAQMCFHCSAGGRNLCHIHRSQVGERKSKKEKKEETNKAGEEERIDEESKLACNTTDEGCRCDQSKKYIRCCETIEENLKMKTQRIEPFKLRPQP